MSFVTASGKTRVRRPALRLLLELVGSMRFAIALLVVLAIASTIGTVVDQGDPYPNYVNEFGPFWADVFRALGVFDVYGAPWFMAILAFLVTSIALCVSRNGPKILADMRSWKDRVHAQGLRAHKHHDERFVAGAQADVAATLKQVCGALGYRFVMRSVASGATLIAAKRGGWSRLGYLSSHIAVIVICLGGLLDSDLFVAIQCWAFHKSWATPDAVTASGADSHRLASWNPSFRGYAFIPEGKQVDSATLFQRGVSLAQTLPFSIELERFRIDYYSTGMPKAFASDIVVIDSASGKRIHASVAVNKPFTYDGISIYQSSYQDGGSMLDLTAWPMRGAGSQGYAAAGAVGGSEAIDSRVAGDGGQSVEFTDFRAINIEDMAADGGTRGLRQAFGALLGSGAETHSEGGKRNLGPSIQYKLRDPDGQAREFRNFMLPVDVDGARVFLAGVRNHDDDSFMYMRIPADEQGSLRQWMSLRAALSAPMLRADAARRYARRMLPDASARERDALEKQALNLLERFAGDGRATDVPPSGAGAGGFRALAAVIDEAPDPAERRAAAKSVLHTLRGVAWDLWQLSRAQMGLPMRVHTASDDRFVELAVDAMSDAMTYDAPVLYQLNTFRQVQASILQLTRAPGEPIVLIGSVMLVIGIFAMFYVRERRVWFLVTQTAHGTHVLSALAATRGTLDVKREFDELRSMIGVRLGEESETD
jgi:cytochrome c biogenesis protein